uniref:Uncharacterized protein n=1 Tax=Gossypium raimondii TaxID=29730 RepID=A0A0D2NCR0_GOSRA|nr:hypothetical protein B456_001G222900 [Gossypium raimondii]
MQMQTTKFETLRMQDSKKIGEFYANLCDLPNQAFTLKEGYSNSRLVKKVLRSLLERFTIKVTTIEYAKILESLKIDELIGSLQTFELNLDESKKVNSNGERSIAFQVANEVSIPIASSLEELQEQIALLP